MKGEIPPYREIQSEIAIGEELEHIADFAEQYPNASADELRFCVWRAQEQSGGMLRSPYHPRPNQGKEQTE